ncbi:hypothetical protein FPV67DRAFT_1676478 [Lyophyllum atratum]|nr:hypothetical protein FPV67DRAFT_1676478 [Lyophyllum atratum]
MVVDKPGKGGRGGKKGLSKEARSAARKSVARKPAGSTGKKSRKTTAQKNADVAAEEAKRIKNETRTMKLLAKGNDTIAPPRRRVFVSLVASAPASTSAAPASTAPVPASTAPVPASTSAAPASTAPVPASTSAAPASTAPVPASTAPVPASTSAAPASTAPVPVSTSAVPASTAPVPASTSAAPVRAVSTSAAAVSMSAAPTSTFATPVRAAPLSVSAVPMSAFATPVRAASPPVSSPFAAPVRAAPAPVSMSAAPVLSVSYSTGIEQSELELGITMDSPPLPQGASRAIGGFFRGRAAGNYYNPVDDEDIHSLPVTSKVKGNVLIYSSSTDPSQLHPKNMRPTMKVPVIINTHLAPVLQSIAVLFPPITTHSILVYDTLDNIWELKGSYNQAVDTNDEIMFTEVNSKPALRILCVSVT